MDRSNTSAWQEIQFSHTTCLCHSEAMGLYVTKISIAPKEDVLFLPHGYKGFWKKEVQLTKENLTIRIETNFGYGVRTYMRAIVERNGQRLLDFDQNKMYILNNCSVKTIDVPPYDWERLFNKIISISKRFDSSAAISYVDEIINLIDNKEIYIKDSFNKEEPIKWNEDYIITLFAANKIRDLINGYNTTIIIDELFSEKCTQLFHKFIRKIQEIDIDLSDKRTIQLADTLYMIHRFMVKKERNLDFFELFLSKSGNSSIKRT
ncbi:MAG: hypothetical protein IJP70_06945 [Bacteroidales bacterium]|nr:hypothetical protein [Bacteroidales bacterium]